MARKLQEIAALPVERRPVDLYAALRAQFYWADRVIVNPAAAEPEVLVGEIVGPTIR